MGWRVKEKPRTIKVTRDIAARFAAMSPPHDRALNERRLMVYERAIKAGEFRPITWATCECLETEETYRVNGQHTATLLSRLESFPDFYVTIESYVADSLDDVSRLWSTFDSRITVRTTNDINHSFAASTPELRDLPIRFVSLLVTGLSYAKWTDGYSNIPPPERAELLFDNIEFCKWCEELFGGGHDAKRTRFLARGPIVGAMHQTWAKSHRAATEFWIAVRDETGEKPDLPDRRLAKWLSSMSIEYGRGSGRAIARRAKQREFYVKCLHAWNAWRKGATTDLKYYPAAKAPAAI